MTRPRWSGHSVVTSWRGSRGGAGGQPAHFYEVIIDSLLSYKMTVVSIICLGYVMVSRGECIGNTQRIIVFTRKLADEADTEIRR